jgi:glucose dehydrogenase
VLLDEPQLVMVDVPTSDYALTIQLPALLFALLMPAQQSGNPMTYMVDGKQYIVVAVSGGSYSGEYIAYALPN